MPPDDPYAARVRKRTEALFRRCQDAFPCRTVGLLGGDRHFRSRTQSRNGNLAATRIQAIGTRSRRKSSVALRAMVTVAPTEGGELRSHCLGTTGRALTVTGRALYFAVASITTDSPAGTKTDAICTS